MATETRTLAIITLAMVLTGCNAQQLNLPHPFAPKPPRDAIQELKVRAEKEGKYYLIFCVDWSSDPEDQFQAELCDGPCATDDQGYWLAGTGHTQQEAAASLLDHQDLHVPRRKKDKECPPEIRGGPAEGRVSR